MVMDTAVETWAEATAAAIWEAVATRDMEETKEATAVATRVVATAVDTTPVAAAAWVEADMVAPLVETEEVTSTTMATIITTLALDMDQDTEVDPNGDKDLPSEELDPTE